MTTTTLRHLNIPANHPAKDEQDTFYITKDKAAASYTDIPVHRSIAMETQADCRSV